MAELPAIPNRLPQVTAPESRVSASQIASPHMELAANLELAAREATDAAKSLATQAGLKAVTRDADGNVQVERAPIVGEAAVFYKNAVQTAAVADGENVVKDGLLKIRHEFRDDPAGFAKAALNFRTEKVKQYETAAGPAVGLALGKVADNTAREFHEGLLNAKESQDLARSSRSIQTQIEMTKNELFAIANGGDQSSPEYTGRLQKIGVLWGSLANNPRMGVPKERVQYEMAQLTSELNVASLDYRLGKTQKTEGPEAALAEADKIMTDPSLNLTPGQRLNYHSRLVGNIQHRVNAQIAIDKNVAGEITEIGKIATNGDPVPPERLAAARQAALASGNPALVGAMQNVETVQPIIADWRKQSPAQLERNLSGVDQLIREKGLTPDLAALRKGGNDLLKGMHAGLKADPLGWADRTGAVPVPQIDWAAPDVASQMRQRTAAAETVAAHYGIKTSYLKPDDKALLQAASTQGGAAMTKAAAMIVEGFGDRAPAVLREISKDAPVLAHMGSLINTQGSQSLVSDAAQAVQMRANPKEFPHPNWVDKENTAIFSVLHKRTNEVYGGAFALVQDGSRAAESTAHSAFFTRSMRNDYDPKMADFDSATKQAYTKTLQEAAGATFDPDGNQFGGVGSYRTGILPWGGSKVLVPGNIRADRFGDVLGAVKDEDVGGKWQFGGRTYDMDVVRKATPVWSGTGYRFAAGDPKSDDPKWVPNANGKPLTLDLEQLEPVLRGRVPGAYSGGSGGSGASITKGQLSPDARQQAETFIEYGLRSLGIGPGGNIVSIVQDVINKYDTNKTFSPMQRLHEYRSSPDYQGNKPAGQTKEETERLRGR